MAESAHVTRTLHLMAPTFHTNARTHQLLTPLPSSIDANSTLREGGRKNLSTTTKTVLQWLHNYNNDFMKKRIKDVPTNYPCLTLYAY